MQLPFLAGCSLFAIHNSLRGRDARSVGLSSIWGRLYRQICLTAHRLVCLRVCRVINVFWGVMLILGVLSGIPQVVFFIRRRKGSSFVAHGKGISGVMGDDPQFRGL